MYNAWRGICYSPPRVECPKVELTPRTGTIRLIYVRPHPARQQGGGEEWKQRQLLLGFHLCQIYSINMLNAIFWGHSFCSLRLVCFCFVFVFPFLFEGARQRQRARKVPRPQCLLRDDLLIIKHQTDLLEPRQVATFIEAFTCNEIPFS